jgi:hypothetical protein
MRRLVALIGPTGVLMTALFFDARASAARPEYTRKTKKECLYCHPPDSFQLTEPGRYYRDHRTLDGYEPKPKPKEGSAVNQHFTPPTSLAVDTTPSALNGIDAPYHLRLSIEGYTDCTCVNTEGQ